MREPDRIRRVRGLLAEFATARELVRACETVRDAGYSRWDAHSPFPVHGLERAMGLRRSRLAVVSFLAALVGGSGAMTLQWWTSAVGYPLVISGKPLFSWLAFVPVTFEVTVLFSALGAVLGMLAFNRLPRLHNWVFESSRFERATDDRFFVSVDARDPKFELGAARALLEGLGALSVEAVEG
jgi:hypothetical protein